MQTFTSLATASHLSDNSDNEKIQFAEKANGGHLQTVKELLNAYNPDTIEDYSAKL